MAPTKHPPEANLSVAKAAVILGVHPNTVRAWSDQGRLPYLRINDRGDRRYRAADLHRFLQAADHRPTPARRRGADGQPAPAPAVLPLGAEAVEERTRPTDARTGAPARLRLVSGTGAGGATPGQGGGPSTYARLVRIVADEDAARAVLSAGDTPEPSDQRRPGPELAILTGLLELVRPGVDPLAVMTVAVEMLHDRAGHDLVAVMERRGDVLFPRVARGVGASRLDRMPATRSLPARALASRSAIAETAPPPHVDEWLAPGRLLHGRIAAPIGPEVPWGLLVVGDEGSAAARVWAPFIEAVARILGLALLVGSRPA